MDTDDDRESGREPVGETMHRQLLAKADADLAAALGSKLTDYERFKALYDSVGCEYAEGVELHEGRPCKTLTFEQGMRKVGGYLAFETVIRFTDVGEFVDQYAWE